METNVLRILESIPQLYPGPGGAAAVLRNGELVAEHAWGFANLESREPMTSDTLMPICSITKQMLCGLLTDLERNPPPSITSSFEQQLSDKLRQVLPPEVSKDSGLTVAHLGNMQSGLRDYWALTHLWGARPEDEFSLPTDAGLMLERMKSFHFLPGSEFSYANTNFVTLARLIEAVTERPLGELLRERIFTPADMKTAGLYPDTANQPGPCIGYEGDVQYGFVPAQNRIHWAGDAGIVASLTDMIAYERFLDRSWTDPQSWYRNNTIPQFYKNGERAGYGFGLQHRNVGNTSVIAHGGALRGYRSYRIHAPDRRLSVVVMLNHTPDPEEMADLILKRVLGVNDHNPKPLRDDPGSAWFGSFLDLETQLAIRISRGGGGGKLHITYDRYPQTVTLVQSDRAESFEMIVTIKGDDLTIDRLTDHRVLRARRLAETVKGQLRIDSLGPITGEYICSEIESTFHCDNRGNMLYGSFDGYLGRGPATALQHIGEDVWALPCPRGMDDPAPGDWTVVFNRDKDGIITSMTIGCWLARNLHFVRKS